MNAEKRRTLASLGAHVMVTPNAPLDRDAFEVTLDGLPEQRVRVESDRIVPF